MRTRRGRFQPLLAVRAGAGYGPRTENRRHWATRALQTRAAAVVLVVALTSLLGVALLLV